jgi:plasmid stabilization system protein ParE
MIYQVRLTSKAKLQLTSAAMWWSEHRSAEQAARWLDGFEAAISSLADRPEQHGMAPENAFYSLPYSVRQLLYGLDTRPTHRAVFEIRGDIVYVVAIRHRAQDFLAADEL